MSKDVQGTVARPGSIKFTGVWLRELHFDGREAEGSTANPVGAVIVKININVADDSSQASVHLDVSVEPQDVGAFRTLQAVIEGVFVPVDEKGKKGLHEFATRQGPSLVFPFAREIIANVTARKPGGVVLLPPLNLYALVDAASETPATAKK